MTAPTSFPCLSSARAGVCLCPGFRCVLLEFGLLTLWDTLQFFVWMSLTSVLAPVSLRIIIVGALTFVTSASCCTVGCGPAATSHSFNCFAASHCHCQLQLRQFSLHLQRLQHGLLVTTLALLCGLEFETHCRSVCKADIVGKILPGCPGPFSFC